MNKAVFLDRDGVVNEVLSKRVKFVNTPKDFHLLPGVGEAILQINQMGYLVFVVTNQGGIGKGYMTENDLHEIHEQMNTDVSSYGAQINDVIFCPHAPEEGCSCRKPHPRMIIQLAKKHHVDLSQSYMVGDRKADILAGDYAGAKTVFVGNRKVNVEADYTCTDLKEFSNWLREVHHTYFTRFH